MAENKGLSVRSVKKNARRNVYVIKNITDLPTGWALASFSKTDFNNNNNPFYIDSSAEMGKVCIVISYPDQNANIGKNGELKKKYIFFVESKYSEHEKIINKFAEFKKVASENSETIKKVSSENAKLLINEIVKTWKEQVKDKELKNSVVTEKLESMFEECEQNGVSDIHFEVREFNSKIRVRVNGMLEVYKDGFSFQEGREYCSVTYNVLGKVSSGSFNPKETLNALVETNINGKIFRARLASAPVGANDVDMVLRILKIEPPENPLTFGQLGFLRNEEKIIQKAATKSKGLIIIAGTTGSGKSTTLQHMMLNEIKHDNGRSKYITVEDPIEYLIPGASQIAVKESQSESGKSTAEQFGDAIRAAMRLDPEVIMIGEVRDQNSAGTLVKATQSGHKVLSTVHAPSAPGIISRLNNLGIERDILGSPDFISALVYQKLLPTICPHCSIELSDNMIPPRVTYEQVIYSMGLLSKEELNKYKNEKIKEKSDVDFVRYLQDKKVLTVEESEEVVAEFYKTNSPEDSMELLGRIGSVADLETASIKFKGDGCSKCKGSGIGGRTVVAEVLTPDLKMLNFITNAQDGELLVYWRKTLGGKFAIEAAYEKMKEGLIDPYDIERSIGSIGEKLV